MYGSQTKFAAEIGEDVHEIPVLELPHRSRTRRDDLEDDIELAALRVLTAYELLGGVRMTLSGARALVREMIEEQT